MTKKGDADYIIVGAGAAGGVMAARLSEDPNKQVLLVEAGSDYGTETEFPAPIRYGFGNPENGGPAEVRGHHWYPESDNPISVGQLRERRGGLYGHTGEGKERHAIDLPRGRIIGGTTSVNSQMWVRGTTEDFDYWSTTLGCGSWTFENVLPFFNAIESDADYGHESFHGDSGPISVRRHLASEWRTADQAWHDACLAAGFTNCDDVNAPHTRGGVGSLTLNNLDRVRLSSALTFVAQARNRPNLLIRDESETTRVLFDDNPVTPRAIGIELSDGTTLFARVEVILCAGAIGSPHLLLRSGIGSSSELSDAGIQPLVDLPAVGKNLRDHPQAGFSFRMRADLNPNNFDGSAHPMPMYLRYTAEPIEDEPEVTNDMLFYVGPLQSQVGEAEHLSGHHGTGNRMFVTIPSLMLELSSGTLRMPPAHQDGSPDMEGMPVIEMDWLQHSSDRIRLRQGVRLALDLAQSKEMSAVLENPVEIILPDSFSLQIDSTDEEIDAWVATHVTTSHHQSSTCRIGDPDDPNAVCDENGLVLGTQGLRVVDASSMPDCPRANTQVTTYMMAERISGIMNYGSLEAALKALVDTRLPYSKFS